MSLLYAIYLIISSTPTLTGRITNPFPEKGRELPKPSLSTVSMVLGGAIGVGSVLMMIDPLIRKHTLRKIELITSPNHVSPEMKGQFRIRTLEEELNQHSQLDRPVHFMIPYLLTNYAISASRDITERFNLPSIYTYISAVTLVTVISTIDEYLDGFHIHDGFSLFDFTANKFGIAFSLLRHQNRLSFIDIYWDYSMTAKPETWQWPWWNYMPAYGFHIRFDIMRLLTGEDRGAFDKYTKYFSYLPFLH